MLAVTYHNYKGGINNLCVVHKGLNVNDWNITARSLKGREQAIKNFKKRYKH